MNIERLKKDFDEIVGSSNQDLIQENANTDGKSPMGIMGLFASSSAKEYAYDMLDEDVLKAFEEGYIHIHDFDFYSTGTTTCCQIPLGKMLETGFTVGECYMRSPSSIGAATALASILLQSNQNQQHGGQAYPNFDYDLAPYVEKSHKKIIAKLEKYGVDKDKIEEIALEELDKEVYQACEAFVHNANSMLTRNGMQVPFISINFGLDTSMYGKLVSKNILKAQMAGLGDNATPIFPIMVFKVKEGINFAEGDPNYDLYKLSLECLSKRLFPNFQFVDTPFNNEGFDINNPDTHIATMGCRTRVFQDINGPATAVGRGNLSFTTINLPMLAQESKDIEDFYKVLDSYLDLAVKQLLDRYEYQKSRDVSSFKLLYSGVWKDETGEKNVGERLRTGSLSVGYIGLAETLKILTGKHHGESDESQKLGLEIIGHMRDRMDKEAEDTKLNFSLLATPAESYSGKSIKKFEAKFGKIDGITDYDFFTNSNHVPVYYNISAEDKIKKEAPYHALTNAGHITYIEVDGDTQNNLEALDDIVKKMFEQNIGYGSINVPLDRCRDCNTQQIIETTCPNCGSDNISRIRRITGYLVGDMSKWNKAKFDEEKNRVKHGKN